MRLALQAAETGTRRGPGKDRMRRKPANRTRLARAFSIIELMAVLGVITALVMVSAPYLTNAGRDARLKGAARDIAGAIQVARAQAIRTRTNHVVMFGTTPNGNPLPSAALILTDTDGDGEIDNNETVRMVPQDPGNEFQGIPGTTRYGKTAGAGSPADDPDPLNQFAGAGGTVTPTSFQGPGGGAVNWLVFQPDGIPRTFQPGPPFQMGNVGTASGAIYLTNGNPATGEPGRDYAIVLTALGGIRVSQWDPAQGNWQ